MNISIKEMIDGIRDLICQTDRNLTEKEVMEALVEESESWRDRLQELEDDDE